MHIEDWSSVPPIRMWSGKTESITIHSVQIFNIRQIQLLCGNYVFVDSTFTDGWYPPGNGAKISRLGTENTLRFLRDKNPVSSLAIAFPALLQGFIFVLRFLDSIAILVSPNSVSQPRKKVPLLEAVFAPLSPDHRWVWSESITQQVEQKEKLSNSSPMFWIHLSHSQ